MKRLCIAALVSIGMLCSLVLPAWPQQHDNDLAGRSLEDLMNIEVTSVSKKEQKASQTAAAIFVIGREDIRRSAANNIPDLLRMVPGLNVAQIGAATWAISARGFNGEFSNKLLVLLDGRSVYLPTTSGVFWDVLDVPLEDIERIEVIRGPGGTTWGANAVNGVINIITSKASETPGAMITAGAGNLDQGFGTVQYGGPLRGKTQYRVFAKYSNQYHLPDLNGSSAQDAWHVLRGGFRADSQPSSNHSLSLQGDLYQGREGAFYNSFLSYALPYPKSVFQAWELEGGYLQGEWRHRHSERTATTLLASYDRYERSDALNEARSSFNLSFEEHIAWNARHDIVWGAGYRYSTSTSKGTKALWLNPASLDTHLFGSFLQDEIKILPDRLSVTLGTKFEHNYYTGVALMPEARVAWNISTRRMLWAAVSRAIRTPATADAAMNIYLAGFVGPGGVPTILRSVGNPRIQNENLTAYEIGYRNRFADRLSLDLAAYYNLYDHLITSEPAPPFRENSPGPSHLVVPLVGYNRMAGETHGVEISTNIKVFDRWFLIPGYTFEQIHLRLDHDSVDERGLQRAQGTTPRHWARLESRFRLSRALQWDSSVSFSDRLAFQNVPSYVRVDTQLSWLLAEKVSLSVAGQNLLRDRHLEFNSDLAAGPSSMIKRSAFLKLAWWF